MTDFQTYISNLLDMLRNRPEKYPVISSVISDMMERDPIILVGAIRQIAYEHFTKNKPIYICAQTIEDCALQGKMEAMEALFGESPSMN